MTQDQETRYLQDLAHHMSVLSSFLSKEHEASRHVLSAMERRLQTIVELCRGPEFDAESVSLLAASLFPMTIALGSITASDGSSAEWVHLLQRCPPAELQSERLSGKGESVIPTSYPNWWSGFGAPGTAIDTDDAPYFVIRQYLDGSALGALRYSGQIANRNQELNAFRSYIIRVALVIAAKACKIIIAVLPDEISESEFGHVAIDLYGEFWSDCQGISSSPNNEAH